MGSAGCSTGVEDRVLEKLVIAEVVQVKETRRVTVLHCQLVRSVFSQHCGMFSHAGITIWDEFEEQIELTAGVCKDMFRTKSVKLDSVLFNVSIGTNKIRQFLTGSLDEDLKCQGGNDGRVIQALYDVLLEEEDALLYEDTGVLTIPTRGKMDIQINFHDQSVLDQEEGTYWWRSDVTTTCPETIVQIYNGSLTIRTNDTNSLVGGLAIIENRVQKQVIFFFFYHS